MTLDHNSYGTLALVYLTALIILIPVAVFVHSPWVTVPLVIVLGTICVWQTAFFRVPRRKAAGDGRKVTSVADGKVVIIEKVYEPEWLKRECIQLSVYMDFFDVHANFWPVDGVVTYYKYHPGEHFLAFKPKASEENEHSCTCIRTPGGYDVFFKQLAGTFARRIVCYSKPGLNTTSGKQCGIIKFGSRIDMYLPLDADIKVTLGQEVRACETVLAELSR